MVPRLAIGPAILVHVAIAVVVLHQPVIAQTALGGSTPAPDSGLLSPETPLTVQVDAGVRIRRRQIGLARDTALRLLDTAGVRTRWTVCERAASGSSVVPIAGSLLVRVAATKPEAQHDVCGEVIRQPDAPERAVIAIYSGCIAGALSWFWKFPELAKLEWGSVAGVVLAHEIAHWLGARHAQSGIMRAHLGLTEWLQFAAGRLTFAEGDAEQMRTTQRSSIEMAALAARASEEPIRGVPSWAISIR